MEITTIISWISENSINIVNIITAVITLSTLIARLTPTQKDDNFVAKVQSFFEKLSNIFLPDLKA